MEVDEEEEEKPKEPEKPKELEEDAPEDSRKKLRADDVRWNMADCTLNVLPVFDGKLLTSLGDSGFQHLLAGVRANAGIKTGRYMFETKIVEQGTSKGAKHVIRVGLSLGGSQLLSEEDSILFDNEGNLLHGKSKKRTNHQFPRHGSFAVVVNRDEAHANAETVSVFVNGVRRCQPQKLPEDWKGKALYPTVVYRGVTLQVNFGAQPATKLPFTCRMVSDAAKADVEVAKPPADGPAEVLLPVGLPEQGAYDWVDDFLRKNPGYTELSPRKIVDWAIKSGCWRKGGKSATDTPDMGFGLPGLDDLNCLKLAKSMAPHHKQNIVVMEMKSNLVAKDRQATLEKFPGFKKRAAVLLGEPSAEYKSM